MAKRRGRKPPRAKLEDNCLKLQPWAGLKAQQQLQAKNHTQAENEAARAECRSLLRGGYGALSDFVSWRELLGDR